MTIATAYVNDCAYGPVQTPSVGASPWTFTNPENTRIWVVINGGTVSICSMSVDAVNFITTGLLGGVFLLNPGHSMQITYTIAPTVKYWPI